MGDGERLLPRAALSGAASLARSPCPALPPTPRGAADFGGLERSPTRNHVAQEPRRGRGPTSAALTQPAMAERTTLPEAAEALLAMRHEESPLATPASSEVVSKLPASCPAILETLLREPKRGPTSTNVGHWTNSANIGRCRSMTGRLEQHLDKFGNILRSRSYDGRCWPTSGRIRPTHVG